MWMRSWIVQTHLFPADFKWIPYWLISCRSQASAIRMTITNLLLPIDDLICIERWWNADNWLKFADISKQTSDVRTSHACTRNASSDLEMRRPPQPHGKSYDVKVKRVGLLVNISTPPKAKLKRNQPLEMGKRVIGITSGTATRCFEMLGV